MGSLLENLKGSRVSRPKGRSSSSRTKGGKSRVGVKAFTNRSGRGGR